MYRPGWNRILLATFLCSALSSLAGADEPAANTAKDESAKPAAVLYEEFKQVMSGVKLVGQFTITGQPTNDLKKEEYEIRSVSKLPTGDLWLFQTRIKYGAHDLTVPLPLEVKWAASTPIITLDKVTIPGLGTFGARVVIHDGKYAGTWSHGEVGGHLFGTIEKMARPEAGDSKPDDKPQGK